MKKSHQNTPSSLRDESPAVRASVALNASLKESEDAEKTASTVEAPRPISSSGFTAVNSSGFTPVNASPAFTPMNTSNGTKRESENGVTPNRRSVASPMGSSKNTPEYRHSGLSATPITNGNASNSLKRQLSHESSRKDNGASNADSDTGERRSKRIKNGTYFFNDFVDLHGSGVQMRLMWLQG
jgi:histone demethylase JARID1